MPSKHSDLVKQLQRALKLLRDLDRLGGMDKYEMAELLGVSLRSIERYLVDLQAAGVPLERDMDGRRSRWRLGTKDKIRNLTSLLDLSHYVALRMAMGAQGPSRTLSAQFATLEDLADNIEKHLGEKLRGQLQRVDNAFLSVDRFSYLKSPADRVFPLIEAIADRRLCQVTYRAARVKPEDKKYTILPIKLFVHDHALYVLCNVQGKKNVTTLNTQRLLDLKVTDRQGEPPAGFDLETWERQAFQLVASEKQATFKLRFAPEIAVYIREREWHPEQKIKELDDGSLVLTFTCADTYEVAAWVASWRDGVEVLEPESLKDSFRKLGEHYRQVYG